MMQRTILAGTAAVLALALAGCEARFGNDANPVDENATAENRAEDGRFTLDAPGFNLQVDIPKQILDRAHIDDGDNHLVPPGARVRGIHVQGHEGRGNNGQVELAYRVTTSPAETAAWYRTNAAGGEFAIQNERRDGDAIVLSGTTGDDQAPFTVRLSPAEGGTEARLNLTGH